MRTIPCVVPLAAVFTPSFFASLAALFTLSLPLALPLAAFGQTPGNAARVSPAQVSPAQVSPAGPQSSPVQSPPSTLSPGMPPMPLAGPGGAQPVPQGFGAGPQAAGYAPVQAMPSQPSRASQAQAANAPRLYADPAEIESAFRYYVPRRHAYSASRALSGPDPALHGKLPTLRNAATRRAAATASARPSPAAPSAQAAQAPSGQAAVTPGTAPGQASGTPPPMVPSGGEPAATAGAQSQVPAPAQAGAQAPVQGEGAGGQPGPAQATPGGQPGAMSAAAQARPQAIAPAPVSGAVPGVGVSANGIGGADGALTPPPPPQNSAPVLADPTPRPRGVTLP